MSSKTRIFHSKIPSLFPNTFEAKKSLIHDKQLGNYATLFRIYINVQRLLGLSPIKITTSEVEAAFESDSLSQSNSSVTFVTTKFQTLSCLLVQSLVLLVSLYAFGKDYKSIETSLGDFANTVTSHMQIIGFFYFLWCKQSDFLKFLNLVAQFKLQKGELKGIVFTFGFLLLQIIVQLYWAHHRYHTLLTDPQTQNDFLELPFFANANASLNNSTRSGGFSVVTVTRTIFYLVYVLLDICKNVLYGSIDASIMIAGFIMCNLGKEFETFVLGGTYTDRTILKEFERMKEIVNSASDTFGTLVFCNYLGVITYYATSFKPLISAGTLMDKLVLVPFTILNTVAWSYLADFNRRVSLCMKSWLYKNKAKLPISGEEAAVIIEDIYNNPVGLECTFFTITYGFLGSMMGLILTYAVIMFQLKS